MTEVYEFFEMMSDGSQTEFGIYSSLVKALEAASTVNREGDTFLTDKVRVEEEESENMVRVWISELDTPEDEWISRYYIEKVQVDKLSDNLCIN